MNHKPRSGRCPRAAGVCGGRRPVSATLCHALYADRERKELNRQDAKAAKEKRLDSDNERRMRG